MQALRQLGLAGTEMAQAQCQTIPVRLLKIGARVRITVRKIWISLAAGHPSAQLFEQAYQALKRPLALRC